ncbi:MAG: recombinase family protein [Pseudonocardiaceae bacterium]
MDGELELLIDGCGEAQPWVTVPRERVDPVGADADAIRDGVRRVLAGESVYSITKTVAGDGTPVRGGEWHAQNVTRILTRPRNAAA